jgi:hypothetical protein
LKFEAFFKHVIILALKAAAGNSMMGMRPKFPEINKQTLSSSLSFR